MATPVEDQADAEFKANLLQVIPYMRAFARSLTGNREVADDLTQDALVRAWRARATFMPGTNLKAWVFTILRNQFYSDKRRSKHQTSLDDGQVDQILNPDDEQEWAMELSYVAWALKSLPSDQREAIILAGAGGFSYEEVAKICGCPVGTVKSRVARGREKLLALLESSKMDIDGTRGKAEDAAREIFSQLEALTPPEDTPPLKKRGSAS